MKRWFSPHWHSQLKQTGGGFNSNIYDKRHNVIVEQIFIYYMIVRLTYKSRNAKNKVSKNSSERTLYRKDVREL